MPWKKANPDLVRLLEKVIIDFPCDRRFMFGSPTFFVNGNMFAGVHQDTVILRFSLDAQKKLYTKYAEAGPFTPMPNRPMREYAALTSGLVKNDKIFRGLVAQSYKYAAALPPKPEKKRKSR